MLAKIKSLWASSWHILVARLHVLLGGVLAVHDIVIPKLTGVDWTPVTTRVFHTIPDDMRPFAIAFSLAVYGAALEKMRRNLTPVGAPPQDGAGKGT